MVLQFEDVTENPVVEEKKPVVNENLVGFYPILDLPSKNKFYPEGTIIYGRPLKTLEVKQIATMTEENSTIIINNILRQATRGIRLEDLLLADKIYIIFWLRANTYKSSGYKVEFKCLKCEKDSTYAFELSSLDVKYFDEKTYTSKITLPESGDVIEHKYHTVHDTQVIDNYVSKNETVDRELLNDAGCIKTINGEAKSIHEAYQYMVNATPGDYATINTLIEDNEVGISPVISVKCDKCGGIAPAGLSFRADFFVPKYRSGGN